MATSSSQALPNGHDGRYLFEHKIEFSGLEQVKEYVKNGSNFKRLDQPFAISQPTMGSYLFVMERAAFAAVEDVKFDCYRPWDSSKAGIRRAPKTTIIQCDGQSLFRSKSRHPSITGLKRQISYFKSNVGYVFVEYIFECDNVSVPSKIGNLFPKPSVVNEARAALNYRSTRAARRVLQEKQISVGKKTLLYLAPTSNAVMTKRGPPPQTNLDKLHALAESYKDVVVKTNTEDGIKSVCAMMCLEEAIEVFTRSLPSELELETFREEVYKSLDEQDPVDISIRANNSQYIARVGEYILYDTTFDLSDLYVSIVVGSCSNFESKKTGKVVHLTLGVMLHTSKSAWFHSEFGKFVGEKLDKVSSGKRLPIFITDGERGLKQFIQNECKIFTATMLGGCDIHLRCNVVQAFSKQRSSEICSLLFGREVSQENGVSIVRGGLLSAVSVAHFDRMLEKIKSTDEDAFQWVFQRRRRLFALHSRRAKLLAGSSSRYRSTNVAECMNAILKLEISRKLPAHEVIEKILHIHADEIAKLHDSVFGKADIQTTNGFMEIDELRCLQVDIDIAFDELGVRLNSSRCTGVPRFFWIGMSASEIDKATSSLQKLRCVEFDKDEFIVKSDQSSPVVVNKSSDKLTCSSRLCKDGCHHVLCVLVHLGQLDLFKKMHETLFSIKLKSKSKPSNGSKLRRRGALRSRSNHVRKHVLTDKGMLDSSASLLDLSAVSANSSLGSLHSLRRSRRIAGSVDVTQFDISA